MGSTKNVLLPYHLTTAQTLSANFSTGTVAVPYLDNVGIQINISATAGASGNFTVNVSLDNVTFIPLVMSGTPAVSGVNDNILISLNQLPFRYMNLTYTSATAGTGSCDIYIMAKEIG